MNFGRTKEYGMAQELVQKFETHKMSIEASVALMNDGVQIPVHFQVDAKFTAIPNHIVSGGLAKWRIFFADEVMGIAAVHNSWKRGCVMISHFHKYYDEYIYVVNGKLKDHLTGDIITTPETAQELQMPLEAAAKIRENVQGWYCIPAGQDHLVVLSSVMAQA